jgi:hypothetical protein
MIEEVKFATGSLVEETDSNPRSFEDDPISLEAKSYPSVRVTLGVKRAGSHGEIAPTNRILFATELCGVAA